MHSTRHVTVNSLFQVINLKNLNLGLTLQNLMPQLCNSQDENLHESTQACKSDSLGQIRVKIRICQ